MTNKNLINTVFISFLSHLTAFGFFSFSFGAKIPPANYSGVAFWGQVLPDSQTRFAAGPGAVMKPVTGQIFAKLRPQRPVVQNPVAKPSGWAIKPQSCLALVADKSTPVYKPCLSVSVSKRKEQVIIFHPLLPSNFFLYFKDRQIAHVELIFKITPGASGNPVTVKRKISSGNLEADLLTVRYMEHYLFLQRNRFTPELWQNIKIDLSAKD